MYFNSGTDLPDNLLSLITNVTTNEIHIGEEYEILFTIIPATTGSYSLIIKSDIYESPSESISERRHSDGLILSISSRIFFLALSPIT